MTEFFVAAVRLIADIFMTGATVVAVIALAFAPLLLEEPAARLPALPESPTTDPTEKP